MKDNKELRKKQFLSRIIFQRRRHFITYIPYISKKPYLDAVGKGDISVARQLNAKNIQHLKKEYEKHKAYDEAVYQLQYECACAAVEICLTAIQSGLADMVAYDVRDEFLIELSNTSSFMGIYELFAKIVTEYATLVHYTLLRSPSSPSAAQMMSYIALHIEEEITLQQVADAAGLSRNYACTLFKKELGMGISDYIAMERISKAKQLLAEGELSLYEISQRLHFCSQSYFSQRFYKITHMTPTEYRKSVR